MRITFQIRLLLFSVLLPLIATFAAMFLLRVLHTKDIVGFRREFTVFLAQIIDATQGPSGRKNLKVLDAARKDLDSYQFCLWITDGDGKILDSLTGTPLPLPWDRLPHPSVVHAYDEFFSVSKEFVAAVVRLDGSPTRYLVASRNTRIPTLTQRAMREIVVYLYVAFSLFLFIAMIFVVVYLRGLAKEVKGVLGRLQKGDLKSRFAVGRFGNISQLGAEFNHMADEIEYLVDQLRKGERVNFELLEELSHDFRTPLTSLAQIQEIFASKAGADLSLAKFAALGSREVAYMERLLAGLFVLAQIRTPRFASEHVDLKRILTEEGQSVVGKVSGDEENELECDLQLADIPYEIAGDEFMIRRLVRNALDNASRFAKRRIWLLSERTADGIRVTIRDDGTGFSVEAMQNFGVRRKEKREGTLGQHGRLSLGLGSVIMKSIAESLGGRLVFNNWLMPDGSVGGAQVGFEIPIKR